MRLAHPAEKSCRFDWMRQPNGSDENDYEPIESLIPPQKHTHAYPPVSGATQQYPTTMLTLTWLLSPLLIVATSQRGTFLVPPASSMNCTVADGSSVRYRCHFTNNRYACCITFAALGWAQRHEQCSFGGFGPSPRPPTRLDEGSSRVKHAVLAENAQKHRASNRLSTATQQHFLMPTASRKSTTRLLR